MNDKKQINLTIDPEYFEQLKAYYSKELDLQSNDIPNEIKISTMTLEGKFSTNFYPSNIYNYVARRNDGIVTVIKGSQKKDSKTSKNKTVFLNQVTVGIMVSGKTTPVSVKVFNNGTLHFTGCLSVNDFIEATYKLCIECQREIAIFDNNGKLKEIKFAEDISVLKVENLYDVKVDMINCIFVIPFRIDRPQLQMLMKHDGYNSVYDSNGHAGVKIRYSNMDQKITIFVFESGSVILILGKQGYGKINEIYTFVNKYLLEKYDEIAKEDELSIEDILELSIKYDENNQTDDNNHIDELIDMSILQLSIKYDENNQTVDNNHIDELIDMSILQYDVQDIEPDIDNVKDIKIVDDNVIIKKKIIKKSSHLFEE